MDIYLIRHGRTVAPEAYNGRTDIALSVAGKDHARRNAALIQSVVFDACYCSPMQRCRQTYDLLNVNGTATICEELREIDFGRWEGLTSAEIADQYGQDFRRWREDREQFVFPEGDRVALFRQRVYAWVDKMLAANHEQVLIVSHAGVIRRMICHLLGLEPGLAFRFMITEAAITLVRRSDNAGVLEYLNRDSPAF